MDELLNKLKARLKHLLESYATLQQAQQRIEAQQNSLLNEKKLLQEKHHLAIAQIERMIARLKLLEKSSL